MEKIERELREVESFLENLKNENLEVLNFDSLAENLLEIKNSLKTIATVSCQEKEFRTDYIRRIAGMLKAVAAVKNNFETGQEILDKMEALKAVSAEELIKQYKKTSAIFRDAFPASFGQIRQREKRLTKNELAQFK